MWLFSEITPPEKDWIFVKLNPEFKSHLMEGIRKTLATGLQQTIEPLLVIEKREDFITPVYRTELFVLSTNQMKRVLKLLKDITDLAQGIDGEIADSMRREILDIVHLKTLEELK